MSWRAERSTRSTIDAGIHPLEDYNQCVFFILMNLVCAHHTVHRPNWRLEDPEMDVDFENHLPSDPPTTPRGGSIKPGCGSVQNLCELYTLYILV